MGASLFCGVRPGRTEALKARAVGARAWATTPLRPSRHSLAAEHAARQIDTLAACTRELKALSEQLSELTGQLREEWLKE